jgi:predicted dehydrogenase
VTEEKNGKAEEKMKVGIIGAGLQGWRRAQAVVKSIDRLVSVADIDPERAKLLAEVMKCEATDNYETFIAARDIDAVVVCTPPDMHKAICLSAFKSSKHVLCEKPLAITVEEAQTMVESANENGVKLKCGFNHRHHPGIIQARKWFDGGVIGELNFIRCRYGIGGREGYEKDWRMNPEISGGGELMDQGMHLIDLCRWFMGEFSQVCGFIANNYWNTSGVEDNAFVLLRTNKGQIASLHASWTQWKNLFSFEIFGNKGYVVVEGLGSSYGTEKVTLGRRAFNKPFREETIEYRGEDKSWYEEWKEFSSAVKHNREPMANGDDGLEALKIARAIYESSANAVDLTHLQKK